MVNYREVWRLIRDSRQTAGLTQRQLAERANTSAAAINRYERAASTPDLATLDRVLRACSVELHLETRPLDDHDESLLEAALELTPNERARRAQEAARLVGASARARREGRVRPLRRADAEASP